MVNPVRQQVMADMKMAGLTPNTQEAYLGIINQFIRTVWVSPEQATEEQVAAYLQAKLDQGMSPGAFRQNRFGLQFLFENTLRRPWGLFKKSAEHPSESTFRKHPRRTSATA